MIRRTTVECEVLSPGVIGEVRRLLPVLSAGGQVNIELSAELAQIVAKFLSVASVQGAVAFRSVDPEISPQQAAEILATELFY
ncbi:hypothetical protein EV184_10834 [Sinorhizobium americanum]|uniref:Uncharacterized protein n=1 Tax=Sinorhizobium americanum TaxID=194963 RepID=A0A4R2BTQ4_9HYPH|nr:hypothetical protein EV184_10834 [Sinorhizobium americanum]